MTSRGTDSARLFFLGFPLLALAFASGPAASGQSQPAPAPTPPGEGGFNYVRVWTAREAGFETRGALNAADGEPGRVHVVTEYFDGLGRPSQRVARMASPAGRDVVTPFAYDAAGRSPRSYLPFESSGQGGAFLPDAIAAQSAFYESSAPERASTDFPFSDKAYDGSPLNRVLREYAPGEAWAGSRGAAQERAVRHGYLSNRDGVPRLSGVRVWKAAPDGTLSTPGAYAAGELSVRESVDEEGGARLAFVDKRGLTVLRRAEGATGFLDTYYVYDAAGRLRYVLPPQLAEALSSAGWAVSQGLLDDYAFRYRYDGRGRQIEKKLPGADPVYTVYDRLDRPVLVQDGNLQKECKWLFTKYDRFGRPALTGLYSYAPEAGAEPACGSGEAVRAFLQGEADSRPFSDLHVSPAEEGEANTGTTLKSVPASDELTAGSYQGEAELVARKRVTLTPGFSAKAEGAPGGRFVARVDIEKDGAGPPRSVGYYDPTFPAIADCELLTVTYYDGYDFDQDGQADAAFSAEKGGGLEAEPFPRALGRLTATKVRRLEPDGSLSERWLTTSTFYDDRGRVVQTATDGHLGGEGRLTTEYGFVGQALETFHYHDPGPGADTVTVHKRYGYDHMGRPLSVEQRTGGGAFVRLSESRYNALGELAEKKVGLDAPGGEALQTMDYAYNVRGWLRGVNDPSALDGDLFAFSLSYAEGDADAGGSPFAALHDGNVAGMVWASAGDGLKRSYRYSYDPLDRLVGAAYANEDVQSEEDFSVSNLSYDRNGNLLTLDRRGTVDVQGGAHSFGLIDGLSYSYAGNRLVAVADAAETGALAALPEAERFRVGDFRDGTSQAVEYAYDANGNMVADYNKGLNAVYYNHQNLPRRIDFGGGDRVEFGYDAAGVKLYKKVYEGGDLAETTDYLGEFVYVDGALQFARTEEGRALPEEDGSFDYEYSYKDHLGNLRVSFRKVEEEWTATFEDSAERADFDAWEAGRLPTVGEGGTFGQALNGNNRQTTRGATKVLAVEPGDTLRLSARAKYDYAGQSYPLGGYAPLVANLFPGVSLTQEGGAGTVSGGDLLPLYDGGGSHTSTPWAYARVLFFGEEGALLAEDYALVSPASDGAWASVETGWVEAPEGAAHAVAYVANESALDVFFDEVKVSREGIRTQENHYYPFGLNIAALRKDGRPDDKFQYNGKELQEEHGLLWNDYGARFYDPQTGRWMSLDPLAEDYYRHSPYNYVFNNPVIFVDPDGMAPDITVLGENGSSFTVKTDLVDVTVDGSSLVGDLGGNITVEGDAYVELALDVGGLVDQSGVVDAAAAAYYAAKGDAVNAMISGFSAVPLVGDLAKVARVGKHVKTIKGLVKRIGDKAGDVIPPSRQIGPIGDPAGRVTQQLPHRMRNNSKPAKSGNGGTRFIDPDSKGGANVRVMNPNPSSKYASQRRAYVVEHKNGRPVDKHGKPAERKSPESHIPVEEYKYKP